MSEGTPHVPYGVAPEEAAGSYAYRGFLFADLRGYTAFVERQGASAGADLLDAYRSLVRERVAKHAGAEIRTEGDSFYVVFASARHAVACGLDILAAAEDATRSDPERPMRLGVGINAGETVQREASFVGSAVNIAARVCAQARAGELLVTPAVRDAVGSGAGLAFAPRGSRRLKGIADPVPLFAVQRGLAVRPRRHALASRWRWFAPVAIGLAVVAAVFIAVVIGAGDGFFVATPTPTGGPSASGLAQTASASATSSASATVDPQAAAEAELIARLDDSIGPNCERADPDDRPAFRVDRETAEAFGLQNPVLIGYDAGVTCDITSFTAPGELSYWSARQTLDFSAVDVPGALLHNEAGRLDIPLGGDCAAGAPAFEEWELGGGLSGKMLCREVFGDAVIEWTYDGTPILGIASRRDGDLASLLRWWDATARFLRP